MAAPRVLIVSASIGNGHVRAAEALELAFRELEPGARIHNVDVFKLSTAVFRHCYADSYLSLIKRAPWFLAYVYGCMDRPRPIDHDPWYHWRVFFEKISTRPFLRLLRSEPWDLIVNTFFLPAELVGNLRRRGEIEAPQVTVITDYETHRNWINEPCEHYFTATDEAALYLEYLGVAPGHASVTGIPIHPVFSEARERVGCLARLGLRGDRPVILLQSGGHAVGPVAEILEALLAIERPLEIVVVAGKNTALRQHLLQIETPTRHHTQVLGYTDQMDELLAAADLVVTKPGGLTVAETLARGAAMVIVHPVPGQEERNSDFLLENGAAIKVNHVPTLAHRVAGLLADEPRVQAMKQAARRLARPHAAFDIARACLCRLHEWKTMVNDNDGPRAHGSWAQRSRVADAAAPVRS